jgi:hypothetical protein
MFSSLNVGQSETISWKEVSRQLSGCTKLGDLEEKVSTKAWQK